MTPNSPGLVSILPNLNSNDNAVLNAALLSKPDIVAAFFQNNPRADSALERLFAELAVFTKSPRGNKKWQNLFVDNQFQNLHVLAHGASAPGVAVSITLNPASHMGGNALAYEGYEYVGYSSITNQMFNGFVDAGAITYTPGAWVLSMISTTATTGVIPAQAAGDPLRLLQPVTKEGNTVHNSSGRQTNIYSETHYMQQQERQAIEITNWAAMSDMTWAESREEIPGKGTITGNMWTNREISLGIKSWHDNDLWGRLHNSGEMVETDAFGRQSTEGLWHWIENGGGNLLTFSGTITDTDIETWNDVLHDNYEDVSEYIILSGSRISNAIQKWARGGHINGQHVMLEQSNFSVDFKKFTYNEITYHIPIRPFNEFNNGFGHAEFGFKDKALFMPVGKTTTENSLGQMVPFVEWVYLANGNPMFDGLEGADKMWWVLGPEFQPSTPAGREWFPTEDAIAKVCGSRTEGSNFKKAQVFAILQP